MFLMNKDKPLARLKLTGSHAFPVSIQDIYSNKDLYFLKSDEVLNDWIDARRSPFHRKYVDELYKVTDIDSNYKYLCISKCIGLNDTVWVKDNDSLTWDKVSPYRNSFSKVLSDIAFGLDKYRGRQFKTPSPELSTDGMSMKCWKRYNNDIYLLKSGGGLAELQYSQAYSEYFASQIASALGLISFVRYDLTSVKDIISSKCKLFTNEKIGYFPLGAIAKNSGYLDDDIVILKTYPNVSYNMNLYKQMLVFDSLIFNFDRHNENYGMLFDTDTLEIMCLAPVFDNDRSLFSNFALTKKSDDELLEIVYSYSPRTYSDYIEQAYLCMTNTMLSKLDMISKYFSFSNHPKYPIGVDCKF